MRALIALAVPIPGPYTPLVASKKLVIGVSVPEQKACSRLKPVHAAFVLCCAQHGSPYGRAVQGAARLTGFLLSGTLTCTCLPTLISVGTADSQLHKRSQDHDCYL